MTVTIAPPTTLTPIDERPAVDLEPMREKLASLATLKELAKQNLAEQAVIEKELKGVIGEGRVGILDGRPIYGFGLTDRIAEARFAKEEPDFYDYCTDTVKVQKLNVARMKNDFPELYDRYRVRQLTQLGGRVIFVAEGR